MVELETAPHDFHVLAMLESPERALEAALADVAPRADDVGPDLYLHHDWANAEQDDGFFLRIRRDRKNQAIEPDRGS